MNKEEMQSKLLEMNELIEKLDPAIRSTAFGIMIPYWFEEQPPAKAKVHEKTKGERSNDSESEVDTSDLGTFISGFEHDTPKDNVMLLAAWLYSQYGAYPIHAKEIKELGDACGLVTPNRADNTMRRDRSDWRISALHFRPCRLWHQSLRLCGFWLRYGNLEV